MIAIILLLFLLVCGRADSFSQNSEHVCNSIDIKANSIGELERYENCTIVEGFVQILFIEHDASVLYFPNIKEITGYLLLYRVLGVLSLKNIFPNLSVIRGDILFFNYSFILFEMLDLQEIGLGNLTNILRGSIRIEKNPSLCYVSTIDWDQILSEKRRNIIRDNRPTVYCPNKCQKRCPFYKKNGKKYHLCWSLDQCQKSCKEECKKQRLCCSSSGYCCHPECLGGCTGSSTSDCISCKNVIFNGRCLKKCPIKTFEYLSWRCLSENECRAINITTNNATVHWKPFEGMCIRDCPPRYMEDKEHNSCQLCGDHCPKVCPETTVDSVMAAKTLHGCTHINGSLNIVIKGERNIIQVLEENLKTIQVIDGFLKVARSFPLISLNFFKNLHTIHGNVLYDKKYSLAIFDNDNLQDLWNCENCNKRLEIKTGRVCFHLNPKLCIDKINALKKYAHIPDWDDKDISKNSNGHKIPCHVMELNVSVWKKQGATTAGFHWRNCRNLFNDSRSILGYIIYYRKVVFKNITILDGRDACGADGWELFDISADAADIKEPLVYGIVTHLHPYTQYAMYIQTLTISSSKEAAQSPIIYFKTCPDTPGSPINVQTHTVSESVVIIIWQPPKQPNGNVTHYLIEVVREHEPSDFFNQRNYCHETFSLPEAKKHIEKNKESTTEIPKIINDNNNITLSTFSNGRNECCPCTTSDKDTNIEYQLNFENRLQHVLYTNDSAGKRVKRSIRHSTIIPVSSTYNYATITNDIKETTENPTVQPTNSSKNVITPTRYNYRVEGKTRLNISDLHHFTEYTIKIQACHSSERLTSCTKYQTCSTYSVTTVRTLAAGGSDDINETNINVRTENATLGSIFFTWKEPKDPNGLIVSYHIEYRKMDDEPEKVTPICITQLQYRQYGGYQLVNLQPGNYSFRLMAVSLAGNGNWTSTLHFVIPENTNVLKKPVLITVVIISVIVLLIFVVFTGWFVYKKKTAVPEGVLYSSVNPEYISAGLVYEPDEWEVDRENVALIRELGQGSFGMVYEGEIKNLLGKLPAKCAVKTINESASHREKIEFLQEASVMKAFNCFHIIKLLGVVSKGHPVLVIMELMTNGDLKSYLRSHRPEENPAVQPPTLKRILQMAVEIADGMAYLANKKFVHRDLAARNCMVAENLTVKIGDFGMTRDVYETDYYRKGGKGLLPVRWMAPESLQDGVFTTHSDVWSYGIVIWEMATLASQPYQGLSNEQVLKYVTHGGTIEKPVNCPDVLYQLMRRCWVPYPENRPSFIKIIEDLLEHANSPEFQKQSFYFTQLNVQDDNADTTTSMLRSPPNENTSLNSFDTEMDIYYFPGTAVNHDTEKTDNDQSAATADNIESGSKENCGNGSKGISVTYSDDSQGSKVSNISNGSIINGHIYFPSHRTTMC